MGFTQHLKKKLMNTRNTSQRLQEDYKWERRDTFLSM